MHNRAARFMAAGALLLAGLLFPHAARGDDLVTLSGTTYHDVRPLRVEPDGVTWEYAEGVCKVDFTDSPESVRRAYHYDAAKAAAYHDAQLREREQAEAQRQRILQENDERHRARVQSAAAGLAAPAMPGADVTFRRAASPAASEATRALGAQMEAAAAKKAVEPTGAFGGIARTWVGSTLAKLGLVSFYQGPSVLNEGPELPNRQEVRSDMHHSPSTPFAPDAAHDSFYTPNYQTRSYYEDVDRSAAFLRDVPLKP